MVFVSFMSWCFGCAASTRVPKAPFQLYDGATRRRLADALKERGLL